MIVTSLGLSTGPYVDESIRGSVAGAYSLTGSDFIKPVRLIVGGCGILLLTKLGGYLFDKWTPGAPFYIIVLLNIVALIATIIVMVVEQTRSKTQFIGNDERDPLISNPDDNHEVYL